MCLVGCQNLSVKVQNLDNYREYSIKPRFNRLTLDFTGLGTLTVICMCKHMFLDSNYSVK